MCCVLRYILQYVLKYITIQYNWIWSMTYKYNMICHGIFCANFDDGKPVLVYDNLDVKNKACHKIKKKMKQKII